MDSISEEMSDYDISDENKKKLPFITFNFNKSFKYIITYWIFEILFQVLYLNYRDYFSMIKDEVQNEYMFIIFWNIAELFSIFLVLYVKKVSKSSKITEIQKENKDNDINSSGTRTLIFQDTIITTKKYFKRKLFAISLIDYLSNSLYYIAYAATEVKDENNTHLLQKDMVCTFDILMRYIYAFYILKIVFYKHSKVSVIMIAIGFAILLISDSLLIIISTDDDIPILKTIFYFGILLLKCILLPTEHYLIKQLFSENNILPESMLFSRGLIVFILIILITPILYFSFDLKTDWCFRTETYFLMTFFTIRTFIKSYLTLKIIYYFSFQSVSFLIISESLGGSITKFIQIGSTLEKEAKDIIFVIPEIIGIFIILIATLIYDEIIIINKWELNKNVRLGIINRGEEDNESMKIIKMVDLDIY